jgi:hypothetical protein
MQEKPKLQNEARKEGIKTTKDIKYKCSMF